MDGPVGLAPAATWTLDAAYAYATERAIPPTDPDGEPVYNCPFQPCAKTFSKRFNLKAHLRVHTGDKPFACSFPGCTRRFMWKSSLTSHQTGHTRRNAELQKRNAVLAGKALAAEAVMHHARQNPHQHPIAPVHTRRPPGFVYTEQTVAVGQSQSFAHHPALQRSLHQLDPNNPAYHANPLDSTSARPVPTTAAAQPQGSHSSLTHHPAALYAGSSPLPLHHPAQDRTTAQRGPSFSSAPQFTRSAQPTFAAHHNPQVSQLPQASQPLAYRSAQKRPGSHAQDPFLPHSQPAANASVPVSQPAQMHHLPASQAIASVPAVSRSAQQFTQQQSSFAIDAVSAGYVANHRHSTPLMHSQPLQTHGQPQQQSGQQQYQQGHAHNPFQGQPHPQQQNVQPQNQMPQPQHQLQQSQHQMPTTQSQLQHSQHQVQPQQHHHVQQQQPQQPQRPRAHLTRERDEKPHGADQDAEKRQRLEETEKLLEIQAKEIQERRRQVQEEKHHLEQRTLQEKRQQHHVMKIEQTPSQLTQSTSLQTHTSGMGSDQQMQSRPPTQQVQGSPTSYQRFDDPNLRFPQRRQSQPTLPSPPQLPSPSALSSTSAIPSPPPLAPPPSGQPGTGDMRQLLKREPVVAPLKPSVIARSPPRSIALPSTKLHSPQPNGMLPSPPPSAMLPSPPSAGMLQNVTSPSAFTQQFLYNSHCSSATSPTWATTPTVPPPVQPPVSMNVSSPKPPLTPNSQVDVQMTTVNSDHRSGDISPAPSDVPISPGLPSPVPPPMLPQVTANRQSRRPLNRSKPPLGGPGLSSGPSALLAPLANVVPQMPPTHIDLGSIMADDEPNGSFVALGSPHTELSPLPVASPIFAQGGNPTSPMLPISPFSGINSATTRG